MVIHTGDLRKATSLPTTGFDSAKDRPGLLDKLTWLDGRYDLDSRRATTYHGHRLAREVVARIPLCAVHQLAFEEVDSGDIRISPSAVTRSATVCGSETAISLQYARPVDQDFAVIFKLLSIRIDHGQHPLSFVLIPGCRFDSRVELDVLLQVKFRCHILEVLPYLFRGGIVCGPIRIPGPSELTDTMDQFAGS